jgi:toll-interacting protein
MNCTCSLLPQGVTSIYLEIYDECSFTMDELIAWAHIPISQAVLSGETHEDWFPLSGKQGEGLEGMINLVLSYSVSDMFCRNRILCILHASITVKICFY